MQFNLTFDILNFQKEIKDDKEYWDTKKEKFSSILDLENSSTILVKVFLSKNQLALLIMKH